jgi:hypothetical protein
MTQADVRRATVASLIGRLLLSTAVIAGFAACSRTDATPILTADMPLHLEDHLDAATVTGSEVSTDLYQPVEWRFDQPQAEWALTPQPRIGSPTLQPSRITLEHTADALRVTLPEENRRADNLVYGGLYIDLPGWRREDWTHILVRARTSTVRNMTIGLNPGPDPA